MSQGLPWYCRESCPHHPSPSWWCSEVTPPVHTGLSLWWGWQNGLPWRSCEHHSSSRHRWLHCLRWSLRISGDSAAWSCHIPGVTHGAGTYSSYRGRTLYGAPGWLPWYISEGSLGVVCDDIIPLLHLCLALGTRCRVELVFSSQMECITELLWYSFGMTSP